jgi:hypothetical protein
LLPTSCFLLFTSNLLDLLLIHYYIKCWCLAGKEHAGINFNNFKEKFNW